MSPTIDVTKISRHGVWLIVKDKEYFLPYQDFPWFKSATIDQVLNVKLLPPSHLHWPELDVDLDIQSLENLEGYPLVYKP